MVRVTLLIKDGTSTCVLVDIAIAIAIDGRKRVLTGVEEPGTFGAHQARLGNARKCTTDADVSLKKKRIHGRLEQELEKWMRKDIGHDFRLARMMEGHEIRSPTAWERAYKKSTSTSTSSR